MRLGIHRTFLILASSGLIAQRYPNFGLISPAPPLLSRQCICAFWFGVISVMVSDSNHIRSPLASSPPTRNVHSVRLGLIRENYMLFIETPSSSYACDVTRYSILCTLTPPFMHRHHLVQLYLYCLPTD